MCDENYTEQWVVWTSWSDIWYDSLCVCGGGGGEEGGGFGISYWLYIQITTRAQKNTGNIQYDIRP
jgi:hypothetical protein